MPDLGKYDRQGLDSATAQPEKLTSLQTVRFLYRIEMTGCTSAHVI
jgi:hypothetical protein